MKLYPLTCSNCGASIEIQDGIDVYYCKTCGYKMILEGQSNAAYNAKMKVKGMEHEERMVDKNMHKKDINISM